MFTSLRNALALQIDEFAIAFKLGYVSAKCPTESYAYGMYNKDKTKFYARLDDQLLVTTPDNLPLILPAVFCSHNHKGVYIINKKYIIPPIK